MAESRAVQVADLEIPPQIEAKIREKHGLTGQEVREAVVFARDSVASWVEDDKHGRRLAVRGTTYAGRPVIAYMVPRDPDDEAEGAFRLKTAIAQKPPGASSRGCGQA